MRKTRWTEQEDYQLEEFHMQGMTCRQISEHPYFKGRRGFSAIKFRSTLIGSKRIVKSKEAALSLWEMPDAEIAKTAGVQPQSIRTSRCRLRKALSIQELPYHRKRICYKNLAKHHSKYKTTKELLVGLGISYMSYYNAIRRYRKNIGPINQLPRTETIRNVEKSYTPRFPKTQKETNHIRRTSDVYNWSFRCGEICNLPSVAVDSNEQTQHEMEQTKERHQIKYRKRNAAIDKLFRGEGTTSKR